MAIVINWLAAIIVAVIYCLIIFFWYHPSIFGNMWLKLVGKEGVDKSKIIIETIIMVFTSFVSVLILEILMDLTEMNDIGSALLLSFLLWIAFIAMVAINQNIFNNRGIKLFFIEYSPYLVALLVSGIILALWQ